MFDATQRVETDANPVLWWGTAGAIAALLLAPLFTTTIPPLLDYPNHLARMLVILHASDDPVIARMYSVDTRVVPNVAMDLLVPPLARVVTLDVAGRVFIAGCLLLPVAGAAVLHRALFHRRHFWPLGLSLVSYNGLLLLGFLNFVAGLGLALLAAGIWVRQARETTAARRVATGCAFALALFLCHLMAVAFYGLLIAAHEIEFFVTRARARRSIGGMARRGLCVGVPFVLPAALFLFGAKLAGRMADVPQGSAATGWWQALRAEGSHIKYLGLTLPFRAYELDWGPLHQNLDLIAFLLLALLVLRALTRRRLRVAAGMMAVAAMALALYPLVPSSIGTASFIDWRLPLFTAFLCFAALAPDPPRDLFTTILTAGVALILVARIAVIAVVWDGHNRDLTDLTKVIAPVEAGARVLAVTTTPLPIPGGDPPSRGNLYEIDATMHLPALLLLKNHAFWPNLFSSQTLQPVHVRPPYLALSVEQGVLPTVAELDSPAPADRRRRPYLTNWRKNFDYVLVMRPTALSAPPDPETLEPLGQANIAALYRVRR